MSVVWGIVRAGAAHNVIPATGRLGGTVRMLDAIAWSEAEKLVPLLVEQIVAPYGVHAQVDYQRGVPPVVNDVESIVHLGDAVERVLGPGGEVPTQQSLGGEDFGWYLDRVPGAMGRLGTRTPGRADVRPAPGQPARGRPRDRHRRQGAGHAAVAAHVQPDHRAITKPRSSTR